MNILVIGGVAAGTKAAAKLKRELGNDCSITLITKSDYVSFAGCGLPYYVGGSIKTREELVVNSPEKFARLTGVNVRCGVEATAVDTQGHTVTATNENGDTELIRYDKLIIAAGAESIVPPIEGAGLKNVFTMRTPGDGDAIREAAKQAKRALIVGGGFIGLELAENLLSAGIRPMIVEMAPHILPGFDADFAEYAQAKLLEAGIGVLTDTRLVAINGNEKVEGAMTDKRKLKTDMVVLCAGIRPCTAFLKDSGIAMDKRGLISVDAHMRTSAPDVYAAGDCVNVFNRMTHSVQWSPMGSSANMEARLLAMNIAGKEEEYPGVLGTAVVKLAGLNAAKTGFCHSAAIAAGFDAESVVIATDDKAHYYPGSEVMSIRLTCDKRTGKLIGAQAIGKGCVDKVIDVAVTAISLGADVYQLQNMDLCYAPPFSTAIHPFSVAVTALINKLSGAMDSIDAQGYGAIAGEAKLISVTETSNLPAEKNIPNHYFADINGPIDGLEKADKIVLVCNKGKQAYFAQNRLRRFGYTDTYVLEGGSVFNEQLFE